VGTLRLGKPWALLLATVGLGLAGLLTLGAIFTWPRSAEPTASNVCHIPLAADKTLGVNADLSQLHAAEREQALAAMEEGGFRWLRQRFPWDAIEPQHGVYAWAAWDELVADISRHNLALIAVLDGSPAWARADEDAGNPLAPPRESRDYGDFVAAFAARYGDGIDHYQVWDEPNITPHWGAREIDPGAYARLLREGAIRVRAEDPGAVILLAALAPNIEPDGANMSETAFLDSLYRYQASEWFDVVATQPYDFGQPVSLEPEPQLLLWRRSELLRKVIEAHGDYDTAVWAVSFGIDGDTAEAVPEAVRQARRDWPWMGPMLWAAWLPDQAHGEYALTDAVGRPGPVYESLQGLAGAPVVAWPGTYPADHPSGRYEGNWRITPSGADIGASGDRLVIPFQGTRLDLMVRRGDYRAFLFVSVDGNAASDLPRDADGRSYVVLYDPLQQPDSVTVAKNLPDGYHEAEIVAERGWGQWAIVGWAIGRGATQGFPFLPLGLGVAALLALTVTGCGCWRYREPLCDSLLLLLDRFRTLDEQAALGITAATAILLYVSTGPAFSLIAVALLAVLLLMRPATGLPLIAVALPFYQLGRPLLGKVFSMVEILTLLTAVGWIANWLLWKLRVGIKDVEAGDSRGASGILARSLPLTTLDWGVVALVVVGAISLLWAAQGRVAAREFRTVLLEAAIFYGLLRVMMRKSNYARYRAVDPWRVADAWVLGAAIIALVGLYQWLFGHNLITADGVWRVRGFYGSPNNLALYLGKVFPLTVVILAWDRKGWRRWAYGLAGLLMALTLFLTYSRGAWLLGVPISLLFLAAMRGRRTLALTGGGLALVVVVIFLIVGSGRIASLVDTTGGTTFFRLQLWRSSWAMVKEHPLLGVGLDNFLYAYRTRYVLPTAWEEFNLSHPHNIVLDFWLRLGILGLVVFLWLLVEFFHQGGRTYRSLPETGEKLLVLGAMAGMVNLVAHGLVDNAFFLVDLSFAFMLMLTLVQAVADRSPTTEAL
jgi:O-antigen ligase